MKTLKFLTLFTCVLALASCSKDDEGTTPPVETPGETVVNFYAPQEGGQGDPVSGPFTKFDFSTGTATESETDWDIAFRGTTILVNGGVSGGIAEEPERTGDAAGYIVEGTFDNVTTIQPGLFVQDTEAAYAIPAVWYSYSGPPNHLITPIPGRVLVFRTHNGGYAKVEILSYYKDAPESPDAFTDEDSYYTFNYIYQPEADSTTF